jgi:[ribosomal protein S5]-alanine N-acetyltransferase
MEHFPTIYTQRLVLRKLTPDDFSSLVMHANNRKVAQNILNMPYPFSEPQAVFRMHYVVQGFKNKERLVFAVALKDTNELIGEISLHLEKSRNIAQLAYWIGEPFWGRGFATEAAISVIRFGFDTSGFQLIFAECHPDNIASQKVLIKCGMTQKPSSGGILRYVMEANV